MSDELSTVRQRMEELQREREYATDLSKASGEWLDLWGRNCGLTRDGSETDYQFRLRIRKELDA